MGPSPFSSPQRPEPARRVGDELAEARLDDLGTVQQATGEYTAAITSLARAIRLHSNLDNRLGEANALNRLGVVEYLTTDYPAAAASLEAGHGVVPEKVPR